jgi:hypothetical protein
MESAKETLEHIRFQLDLLKLNSMPVELTSPSVMKQHAQEEAAMRAMEELHVAVAKLPGR